MREIPGRIIFKTIVGSQAYGTNVEGSDIDIKGVYIQTPMEILTFGYKEEIEVTKDEKYYEVRKFIELLGSANPTVLEMLFMPEECVLELTPEFQLILGERSKFVTKKCRHSFGGYAIQQIKKAKGLGKKMNWEKGDMVRKTPLDFCYVYDYAGGSKTLESILAKHVMKQEWCALVAIDHIRDGYALYYDADGACGKREPLGYKGIELADSNSIRLSSVPISEEPMYFVHYNKDGYTQHCNAYKEYETWLRERNEQRYVDIEGHGQKIDGKNMLHCQRLIDTGIEIAEQHVINVRRPNGDYLRSIRKGKVDLQTLLDNADAALEVMDKAFQNSTLPDDVPNGIQQELLTKVRSYGEIKNKEV